jgi:hypothetical protein
MITYTVYELTAALILEATVATQDTLKESESDETSDRTSFASKSIGYESFAGFGCAGSTE